MHSSVPFAFLDNEILLAVNQFHSQVLFRAYCVPGTEETGFLSDSVAKGQTLNGVWQMLRLPRFMLSEDVTVIHSRYERDLLF